jgi:hypothetical protein
MLTPKNEKDAIFWYVFGKTILWGVFGYVCVCGIIALVYPASAYASPASFGGLVGGMIGSLFWPVAASVIIGYRSANALNNEKF